jgi:glycosyltransferase involved in cell wall biosynthesis
MATNASLKITEQASSVAPRFDLRLGVLSQVPHWIGRDATPWAYEPYVREMRLWADLFTAVDVYAPPGKGMMHGNNASYERANTNWIPVNYSLAAGWPGIRRRLTQLPGLIFTFRQAIRRSDFVLVRSPGHFGLVGSALVRVMRRPSLTKWAGENGAYRGEAWPIKWNRWVETLVSRRNPVLVYGPARRAHQIEFIPALLDAGELMHARALAQKRTWGPPWRIVSAGRLEPVKGFELALRGLGELAVQKPWIRWQYTLIGDGSARATLSQLACALGIADRVRFAGALPFHEVQQHYAAAHVVIMPGTKEGWPKIIAEAWAHGAVPVAAKAGLVPWILRNPAAGIQFEPTPRGLADALHDLLHQPARVTSLATGLFPFAAELSLDQFKVRLEKVLIETCGLEPVT